MEKRLFFYIMNPAMVTSWTFGILCIPSGSVFDIWLKAFKSEKARVSKYMFPTISKAIALGLC